MDKIFIKGLRVYAYHGVNEDEQRKGQPFELDITLKHDLTSAGQTDELSDTINYSKVSKLVVDTMKSQKDKLIERAATRVAQAILQTFPVNEVTVKLKKPRAPVAADFKYMAVEITKQREKLTSI